MDSKDWKKLVATVAPSIATALGSPVAGVAVAAISKALLGKDDATEDEVAAAVMKANPEQLLALRNADNTFKLEMERLGVDLEKVRLADVQDARALAKVNMWPQIILSGVFIVGYFAIVWALVSGELIIAPEQSAMINVLLGVLTAGVASIMQFWFGSSSGSKEKTSKLTGG